MFIFSLVLIFIKENGKFFVSFFSFFFIFVSFLCRFYTRLVENTNCSHD